MVPPTADEARRLVDVYYRPYFPDMVVGAAVPDVLNDQWAETPPPNTGWTVQYTANGASHSVHVVGYNFTDLLPIP